MGYCLPSESETLQMTHRILDIRGAPQKPYKWHRPGLFWTRSSSASRLPNKGKGKKHPHADETSQGSDSGQSEESWRTTAEGRRSQKLSALRKQQFKMREKDQMKQLDTTLQKIQSEIHRNQDEDRCMKSSLYKRTGITLDDIWQMMAAKEGSKDSASVSTAGKRITYKELTEFMDEQAEKDLAMARGYRRRLSNQK